MRKLVVLFLATRLFAQVPINTAVDPATMPTGNVDIISGSLVNIAADHSVRCLEPISIYRTHASTYRPNGHWGEWRLHINRISEHDEQLVLEEPDGNVVLFECDGTVKLTNGVSNTAGGILSGKTSIANWKLEADVEGGYVLLKGNGERAHYRKIDDEDDLQLHRRILPSGNRQVYLYDGNELSEIRLLNASESVILGWVSFAENETSIVARTSDDREIHYEFDDSRLLKQVASPTTVEVLEYSGVIHPAAQHVLNNRALPNSRGIEVSYYSAWMEEQDPPPGTTWPQGPCLGSVYQIFQPTGHDQTPRCVATFDYGSGVRKEVVESVEFVNRIVGSRRDGHGHPHPIIMPVEERHSTVELKPYQTDIRSVTDANGQCWKYTVTDNKITAVIRPDGSKELRIWDRHRLAGKAFVAASGRPLHARTFEYDERDNVVKEIFWGNHTGKASAALELDSDGMPLENGVEQFQTIYKYSDDGFNNLTEERCGRKTVCFHHKANTDLVVSKLTYEDGLLRQEVYCEYDDNAALIISRARDGCSDIVTRFVNRSDGLPQVIEVRCGVGERLLKRTRLHYNAHNEIIQRDVYDANGDHRYSLYTDYNERGQPIREVDALGQECVYEYDENGNNTRIQGPGGITTVNTYDFSNRLIATTKIDRQGESISTHSGYDLMSRRVSDTDENGNETHYTYDSVGNVIEESYPPYLSENNEWIRPIKRYEYDELGNVTLEIDENGEETRSEYNSRKQPVEIHYPDGSSEQFEYDLEGMLLVHTHRSGSFEVYTRDYLGRVLTTQLLTPEGRPMVMTSTKYTGSNVAEFCDGAGNVTRFSYDEANRLLSKTLGKQMTALAYDSLGRIASEQQGERIKEWDYDLLGRQSEERIVDPEGVIYSRVSYGYDRAGNRVRTTTYQDQAPLDYLTEYNVVGEATKTLDPLGNTTRVDYEHGYSHQGQQVFRKIVTDPKGFRSILLHDPRGNLISLQKVDSFGRILSQLERSHRATGQRVREIHTIFPDERQVSTLWSYGPCGRVEELSEGGRRITHYLYDDCGRLVTTIKPSGTEIRRTYDGCGRVSTMRGPDFHYSYVYDGNHNVTQVRSEAGITTREYDANQNLISETLETGLSMAYTYDGQGRRSSTTLPDGSSIQYTYNAEHLITVARSDYTHRYTAYDLQGNLLEEEHISGAISTYTYDACGRYLSCRNQSGFEYDPSGNLIAYDEKIFAYDDLNQLVAEPGHSYAYDSLHNRTAHNGAGYSLNDLNQVSHLTYDADGRLTTNDDYTYIYDSLDRLIALETPEGTTCYRYDPFHRRLSRDDTLFIYDHRSEIGAVQNGQITQLRVLGRVRGAEIGAAVAIELDSYAYTPIHDHRGCVVALLNAYGFTYETYTYTAFGECTVDPSRFWGPTHNPYRFLSKRYDPESGFTFFGRRYYDSTLGRWTTPDPAGHIDGPNLYAYVLNNPQTHVDYWGLFLRSLLRKGWQGLKTLTVFSLSVGTNGITPRLDATVGLVQPGMSGPSFTIASINASRPFEIPGRRIANGQICFINGMNNELPVAQNHARYLSQIGGGVHIKGIHLATHGVIPDVARYFLTRTEWFTHRIIKMLHDQWDDYFRNSGDTSMILQVSHSEGAVHVLKALKTYDPALRARIRVVAVAPSVQIDEKYCEQSFAVCSQGDLVHRVDRSRGVVLTDRVELLPHRDAAFMDHSFQSPTFEDKLEGYINQFIDQSGGLVR